MSDLISRKAVYGMLHGLGGCGAEDEWSRGWDKAIDTTIDELGDIPTAYDVDKVVEELKRLQQGGIPTRSAINIVKGAVKDE